MTTTTQIHAFAAVDDGHVCSDWFYTPRPLQPDDVELRVVASGICHSDCHQLYKEWGPKQPRPLVPGHEIVGIVTKRGDKAKYSVGDRVAVGTCVGSCLNCDSCKIGEVNYCRFAVDTYTGTHLGTNVRTHGGFALGMVVDSRYAFKVPDTLPSTTAAPLMCAGATVYSPLKRYCKPSDAVAVVGIGGLGHFALQFARALGMTRVCAITTSKDKTESAKLFGATEVVVSSDKESMKKAAGQYDFMLVTVSADLPWADYLRLLKVGGHLCLVGLPPSGQLKLNPFQITAKRLIVSGSNTASLVELQEMLDLAAKADVRGAVELLPLSAWGANEAVARVMRNAPRYRCVMVPQQDVKL